MKDPYVYPHTNTLINLANIQDDKKLSFMEAEYTSLRLAELVTQKSASCFDFFTLCNMHYYIFQDIYEWAGKTRTINMEKSEAALGGISIEYSDYGVIERDTTIILKAMNQFAWEIETLEEVAKHFSKFKQWLLERHISEKSYYYWLRKIRKETYEQMNAAALYCRL